MRKMVFFSALLLIGCSPTLLAIQPEISSGWNSKPVVQASKFLAVTSHPQATEVAHQILKRGGSAVDAAIAAQMVLTLVEPQSSGIGGGGFLLHYSAKNSQIQAFDGRETAPTTALPSLFLDENDAAMNAEQALQGARAVGTPGLLAMLGMAHKQYGRLPWPQLLQPAIELAENGFVISPRLQTLIQNDKLLCKNASTRQYFCDEHGQAKVAGTVLQNPLLAGSLRLIAKQGPAALYGGTLGDAVVDAVEKAQNGNTTLSRSDLEGYQALQRAPLCQPYRQWRICGMPPPSSGGIAVLQMLQILQRHKIGQLAPNSVDAIHLFSEAGRLAFADRDRYIADPDMVDIPVAGLLDPHYLAQRAALIKPDQSIGNADAGQPQPQLQPLSGKQLTTERPSTSHMSIVDRNGNVVALTSSLADAFGSRLMVRGFLLNNQLSDFSFQPFADGQHVANRVGSGKRPRSSMSPVIVLDRNNRPVLALGSAGGPNIINHVTQTLVGVLEWQQPLQTAIEQYHYGSRNGPTELEKGFDWSPVMTELQRRGQQMEIRDITSGLHGVQRDGKFWRSGTDPRREGVASGE